LAPNLNNVLSPENIQPRRTIMRAIPILILGVAIAAAPAGYGQQGGPPGQTGNPPNQQQQGGPPNQGQGRGGLPGQQPPLPQPTVKPAEMPGLSGEWVIVGGEREGQKYTAERVEGLRVSITADTITLLGRDNKPVFVARYALNTAKTPPEINMEMLAGPTKGQLAHGIVRFDDPNLAQICYTPGTQGRPEEFRTMPGGSIEQLFILQRGPVNPPPAASTPSQPVPLPGGAVVGAAGVAGVVGVFGPAAPATSWRVVAGETNGKALPADELRAARVVINGSTAVVTLRQGQPPMVVRCVADTTQTPNVLTMTVVEGPHRGQTAPGIVDVMANDRMRICYAANGLERPKEFRTQPEGPQQFLFTLQLESGQFPNQGQANPGQPGSGPGNPGNQGPPNRGGGPPAQNPPGRGGGGGGGGGL